jgi:hypothetical protein
MGRHDGRLVDNARKGNWRARVRGIQGDMCGILTDYHDIFSYLQGILDAAACL